MIGKHTRDTATYIPKCWRCKKDAKKAALLQLCKCTKVIHGQCLEKLANARFKIHCPFCFNPYPLERGFKSLLQCYRGKHFLWVFQKSCLFFFLILVLILCIFFVIGSIVYLFILFDEGNLIFKSIVLFYSCLFLYYAHLIMPVIIDCRRSIYLYIYLWYRNLSEWKLIKKYLL